MLRPIAIRLNYFKRNYSIKNFSKSKEEYNHINPLLDTFGRHHNYLRISLTERCNLRCKNISMHSFRLFSTNTLTHTDADGTAKMVNISDKTVTHRKATAQAKVKLNSEIIKLIEENLMKKGDVLSTAELAGIIGAKKTSELIPLCHNITLNSAKVKCTIDENEECVVIIATVKCDGKTGVEMEALTAASIAALTVYDMCKAVSHEIVISDILLLEKSGGTRGKYHHGYKVRKYDTSPIESEQVIVGSL